ncbi:MAG: M56 family metallopeptidase [Planctomycetota bacterium]|jgi:beta-lactamase regulating signal transducer with metallopeptidase domain
MGTLENIFQAEIIQRLGWTLVHFAWQATAIGLILAIVLKLLHKSSANVRYIIACMALALIVLMPIVTIRMIGMPVEAIDPVKLKQAGIDLPKAGFDLPVLVEMPQVESPPVQATVTPRVALKDRFVGTVELALPYIVLGWLAGVLGLSIWHLGGWTQLQRLRRKMVKQVGERVNLRLRHLADQLGIKQAIEIAESAFVQVPAVVGWLRPVILLPASVLTGLSGEQLETILAHELAHIKRCDYLVNMLQTSVEILGFYHPAVWWISHKIRFERENCCDDLAVSLCSDRVCYAKALTTMEEIRASYRLAVAVSGGSLFDRIRRLLGKDSANEGKLSWLAPVIAILLIMALLISVSFAMSSRTKTDIEPAAKKLDYSSVTVEKGVGFDDIIVGDVNCTREFVRSRLGKPDDDVKDTETNGWWLNYRKKYGLDFWFNKNNILKEIRLNKGFKGKLATGISVSSSKEDVFERYGYPVSEKNTDNLHRKNDDRVLYKKGQTSRIFYADNLLLFWFDGNRINQIVTYPRKTKPAVRVDGIYSIRYFVRVVTDDENDRVTFEGRELDFNRFPENLEPLLENVPDRAHTVLEIAFAPGTMLEKGSVAWLGIVQTLGRLQEKYGFEYLSIVGEHPLGSKGGPTETYCQGLLHFGKDIPLRLESAEKPPLIKCRSIKFKKVDDTITSEISMNVTSYPKAMWEFRLRLLDAEAKEIKAVYQTFENSGIVKGVAEISKQSLKFPVVKLDSLKSRKFEVRIRQIDTAVEVEGEELVNQLDIIRLFLGGDMAVLEGKEFDPHAQLKKEGFESVRKQKYGYWQEVYLALSEIVGRETKSLEIIPLGALTYSDSWEDMKEKLLTMADELGFSESRIETKHKPLKTFTDDHANYLVDRLIFSRPIPLALVSPDEKQLVKCNWIKFSRNGSKIKAELAIWLTSYPETKWKFTIRLLDSETRELSTASQIVENTGIIIGFPFHTEERLNFVFDKVDIVEKARSFELKIKQISEEKPAVEVEGEFRSLIAK